MSWKYGNLSVVHLMSYWLGYSWQRDKLSYWVPDEWDILFLKMWWILISNISWFTIFVMYILGISKGRHYCLLWTAQQPNQQSLMTMTRCAWSELPVLTDKWHWVKLHSHSIHIHQVSLAFFYRVWEHKTYLGTLVNTITLDTVYDVTC